MLEGFHCLPATFLIIENFTTSIDHNYLAVYSKELKFKGTTLRTILHPKIKLRMNYLTCKPSIITTLK